MGAYDEVDEFHLDAEDELSMEDARRYYRWKGEETIQNIIQLGSDSKLSSMTFSDGGRRVKGTWAHMTVNPGQSSSEGSRPATQIDMDVISRMTGRVAIRLLTT